MTYYVLYRNSSTHSLSQLHNLDRDSLLKIDDTDTKEASPSLDLLLQVQRLMVARIFPKDADKQPATMDVGMYPCHGCTDELKMV